MKHAIVDLGSNTVRLSVYDVRPEGSFRLLFSEKEMAGIVNYIDRGVLSREGIGAACGVLEHFQSLLGHFGMEQPHVFATASLRNIRNTGEAVEAIRLRTGLSVDVISGETEAKLGYLGALPAWGAATGALFDIGGGSTEILEVRQGRVCKAESLPIGSLNLFRRHVARIWPKKGELADIRRHVREALAAADLPEKQAVQACGVGGTARAILKIAAARGLTEPGGRTLPVSAVHEIAGLLLERDRTARDLILRSCPDRIHTILPGVAILDTLAELLCRESIFISPYGVREGYLCHKLLGISI